MMNKPEPAVSVQDLRVVRQRRTVLDDVSFDVPVGQVVGLLGPSGCGKSTLLRSIVGVQKIASGNVEVLGTPAGDKSLRTRVGYVTQAASVYTDLTLRENLEYFAAVVGARDKADVDRVIDLVDLSDRSDSPVGMMSGGQVNRASLAAALLGKPKLLILDEPTVGLDPALRRDLWALFARLADEGVTLLVSSHVLDEASRCDRLLLLRDGRLLADDTLAGLLDATGTDDVESAFLTIVEKRAA
ncbi:MAG: ABC transporter ATP-binding protein [Rhodococcus sp. (in: high G+C Gram-positive bacteria)]